MSVRVLPHLCGFGECAIVSCPLWIRMLCNVFVVIVLVLSFFLQRGRHENPDAVSFISLILEEAVMSGWSYESFLFALGNHFCWPSFFFFFNKFYFYLFIYFWLCWVFVAVRGLSLVVASGGHSSSRCAGLSLSRPLLLRSTGSRRAGSVVVAHGPSCSAACGIFADQGSNPCPLHWQADSQPLCHQGSPWPSFLSLPEEQSEISATLL